MSKRETSLKARAEQLRTGEHIAQIRLRNAERGLDSIKNVAYEPDVTAAFVAEVDAARAALSDIHEEQQRIIAELDMHTTDYPDMAMIMVDAGDGYHVYERRDPDNTGNDETCWYPLNAPDDALPSTFNEITGEVVADGNGDDRYRTFDFYRLYTAEEVDDLLDQAILGL